MLKLLNFLITGCWHDYIFRDHVYPKLKGYKFAEFECTRCGHIKRIEA